MDAYQSLDVSPTATDEEIKKAYRRAQRRAHPDLGGGAEDAIRINDAYSCISDANKRALYDRAGRPHYSRSTGRHDAPGRPSAGPAGAPPRARAGAPSPGRSAPRGHAAPREEGSSTSAGTSRTTFEFRWAPGPSSSRTGTTRGPRGADDPLGPFTDPWGKRWASFRQFQLAFLLQYDGGGGGQRTGPVAGYRDRSGRHWATEDDFRRAEARARSGGTRAAADAQARFERRLRQQAANPPGPSDRVRDEAGQVWASADHYRWAREDERLQDHDGTGGPTRTAAYGFRAPDGVLWTSEDLWRAEAARRAGQRQEWTRRLRGQEERLRDERLRQEGDERRRQRAAAEQVWQVRAESQAREERLLRLQSRYMILVGFRSAGWALGAATAWIVGLIALVVGVVVTIGSGAPPWMLLAAALVSVAAAGLWWLLLSVGGRVLGRILSGLTAEELRELR